MMKQFHFRDWLRTWLFREESHRISSLMQLALDLRDTTRAIGKAAAQFHRDVDQYQADLRKLLEEAALDRRQIGMTQTRVAEIVDRLCETQERHYLALLELGQKNNAAVVDLEQSLDPVAKRAQRASRPITVQDWDEVQRQNLKQFEENNGQSIRK